MAKRIIEVIRYVPFFHPELFSICFRFSDDIIDGANSCRNNMFSLLKAVHLSFRYDVDGPFRRRQIGLCITGFFNRYPMKDQLDRKIDR